MTPLYVLLSIASAQDFVDGSADAGRGTCGPGAWGDWDSDGTPDGVLGGGVRGVDLVSSRRDRHDEERALIVAGAGSVHASRWVRAVVGLVILSTS